MLNKVLIKLIIPELDEEFDVFIPVNEVIWKIKKLIIKSVSDITGIPLNIRDNFVLMNRDTCEIYNNNDIVINTDIRNGTIIIMLAQ